ncbi:fungal-specific transcription factor domain-containing protein [Aspergillus pseudoustus]|uniref:Fungal-specific transcription factor domain-containing protein n=1 Tax=Aspergillus pseudoustus TaxID=1810923 RepID=A0ABR4JWA2_9EURO
MDSPRRARNRAACKRCQRRKIRCDGNLPSCSSCQKAGVPCINDGKQEVHRSYIANMENRIRWLESIVRDKCSDIDLSRGPEGPPDTLNEMAQLETPTEPSLNLDLDGPHSLQTGIGERSDPQAETSPRIIVFGEENRSQTTSAVNEQPQQAHEIGLVSLSPGGDPRYIGPSSGYFFAQRILSSAGCRRTPRASAQVAWDSAHLSLELLNSPAALPAQKESALDLSDKYFQTIHIIYPFLHKQSHMEAINRVYASQEENPLETFQVYMVLAVAALNLSRQCKVHLPVEGYYASAMKHLGYVCNHGSVASLQCLLLLMVYALYNPSCGINIWNLNYQCLASVVDLGLQRDVRASSSPRITLFEQEMRTRIFWVVYTFDRTVCTMMGRPIGIRDEACDIRFPLTISDSDLDRVTLDGQGYHETPSHMSYSVHVFRLAKLNSEIKYVMHSVNRDAPAYAFPPVRDISTWQQDMITSLDTWLAKIPPKVPGVHFELLQLCRIRYHETMILLLRPSPGIPNPPDDILNACFQHGLALLQVFGDLYANGGLPYSRFVVHSIFLGTLVMLYCIWRLPWTAAKIPVSDLISRFNTAQNILSSIGEHWSEATRSRDCIKELSAVTIQRLLRTQPTIVTTAQSAQSDPAYQPSEGQPQQYQVDRAHGEGISDIQATDPWSLNGTQPTSDASASDFSNLFDDFLQGDFPGWSGISDIDGLMWEVFNTSTH